jgi:hypothetical protein
MMTAVLLYAGPSLKDLHENYAKKHRIDDRAAITARRELTMTAPPTRVWAVLSDVRNWDKNLEPGVHGIRVPDGVVTDAQFTRVTKGAKMTARFAVVEPERELAWTGSAFGAKVVHRYVLQALPDGGTRVVVEESMAGPLLAVFFYTNRKLQGLLETCLATLKTAAETAG